MKAVRRHTGCKSVLLYLQRWLEAPVRMPDGTLTERERGTPQGAVVRAQILANLFLHYVLRSVDAPEPSGHSVRTICR